MSSDSLAHAERLYQAHLKHPGDVVIGTPTAFLVLGAPNRMPGTLEEFGRKLADDAILGASEAYAHNTFPDDYFGVPALEDDPDAVPLRRYARFVEFVVPCSADLPEGYVDRGEDFEPDYFEDDVTARFYWLREQDGLFALLAWVDAQAEQGAALDAALVGALYGAIAARNQPRPMMTLAARMFARTCGRLPAASFGDIAPADNAEYAHSLFHLAVEHYVNTHGGEAPGPVWALPSHPWHRADVLGHLARVLWRPACVEDLLIAYRLLGHERSELTLFLRLASEEELLSFRADGHDARSTLRDALSRLTSTGESGDDDAAQLNDDAFARRDPQTDAAPGIGLVVDAGSMACLGYVLEPAVLIDREWTIDNYELLGGEFETIWLQWLALSEIDMIIEQTSTRLDEEDLEVAFDEDAPYFLWPSRILPSIDRRNALHFAEPDAEAGVIVPNIEEIDAVESKLRARIDRTIASADWCLLPALDDNAEFHSGAQGYVDRYWQVCLDVPEVSGLSAYGVRQIRMILTGSDETACRARYVSLLANPLDVGAHWLDGVPIIAFGLHARQSERRRSMRLSSLSAVLPDWATPIVQLIVTAALHDIVHGLPRSTPMVMQTPAGAPLILADWAVLSAVQTGRTSGLNRLSELMRTALRRAQK